MQTDLSKRLGLHPEHWLDALRVNDRTLIDCFPFEKDFLVEGWKKVTEARKALLELAGLPADRRLFWCRRCGNFNHSAASLRDRICEACGRPDNPARQKATAP
jgi:ribosomal protein L37E